MSSVRVAGVPARGRRRARGPVVAVTGAGSPTGRAVTAALAAAVGDGIGRVLAVDEVLPDTAARAAADGVSWRDADTASPAVAEQLRDADVVVHVACADDLERALAVPAHQRRARAVASAQAVLTAAAAVGARHTVVVTSAMVLGARPDGPVPLPEDGPLLAVPDDGVVGDLLAVEQVAARARAAHPGVRQATLRPAALVGPGVDTLTTRHFEAPRLLAVRDAATAWQFCHVDDVGAAAVVCVVQGLTGDLTVGAPGWLGTDQVERLSGMRRVELPSALAFGTAERLHRVGVLPMPAGDLHYVVHLWVVGSERLAAAGWSSRYDNEACLRVLLANLSGRRALGARRIDGRDAALGAAGAAVALVGTAAVWRRARARQDRRRTGRA